jgi:hypothetical protein
MVSGSVSLPSPGCFSPFPHGTGALSVASGSLALGGGPPCFPPDSACPAVLTDLVHPTPLTVAYGTLTRCGGPFQQPSADQRSPSERPAARSHQTVQPRPGIGGSLCHPGGLGSARFARRYSGPPFFSSGYVRCFSSPGAPRIAPVSRYDPGRVAPFGNLWLTRSQHVPRAFRRVGASFVGRWRLGIPHVLIYVVCLVGSGCRLGDDVSPPVPTRPGRILLRGARGDVTGVPVFARRGTRAPRGATHVQLSRFGPTRDRSGPGSRWSRGESNPGPPPCKGGALPTELRPPTKRTQDSGRRPQWRPQGSPRLGDPGGSTRWPRPPLSPES